MIPIIRAWIAYFHTLATEFAIAIVGSNFVSIKEVQLSLELLAYE